MHTTREPTGASKPSGVATSKAASVATAKPATVTATTTTAMPTAAVLGKRGCANGQQCRQGTDRPQ